ncbi:MAG: S41 family peptidase [Planctomycetota bacterium]|nr:S41 family peptidase [Planctomycetota bacterium]MCZ6736010.1 S41 family peptidase [Planctomycetota bacterium]
MKTTQISLDSRVLIVAVCVWGACVCPLNAQDEQLTIERWSELVWESASQGDRGALETYLKQIPERAENEDAKRLRASLDQHDRNLRDGLATRRTDRADARERMRTHLAADKISQALTTAVEVQTLSDDLEAVLDDPEIAQVVTRAKAQIPIARRDGDWLLAYELLYRLNVLYEHTSEYEEELDRTNRRLVLLSNYAPQRMHELRSRQAQRFGEKPLDEFNPRRTEDWKLRLHDINHRMVKEALRAAARDHIEADGNGWRPLLNGALQALKMLATMPALAETYPNLQNAEKRNDWIDFLDQKLLWLDDMSDRELRKDQGYWKCSGLLNAVVEKSRETIQLPNEVLYREFGDGAMRALDEYSEIIWPNKLRRFKQSTQGSFVGVGILIRHDEKRQINVVNPLEGTPAYFAGIKPNDRIAEVDGVSTVGWSLNDAVDKITGRKGTTVELGIRREGAQDIIRFPITRDVIKIRSVKGWWKTGLDDDGKPRWDWFIDPDTRIAYIRLTAFNEDTYKDLKEAWDQIREDGRPNGLILDLRYNPGGLLPSAVDVSNMFVRDGVIVSGETKDQEQAWPDRRAEPRKAAMAGLPTVVLINQGSASASEIVAGCLQAHRAAVVVGKRSFGKGSVQTVHRIAQEARLKLTTQYYRLPKTKEQRERGEKGRLVHRRPGAKDWGVDPDIVVDTTPQQIKAAYDLRQAADILREDDPVQADGRPDITDLLTKGLDPQLETALLILQARALGTAATDTRRAMAN